MTALSTQPWLASAWFDGAFILAPPFAAVLAALCFTYAGMGSEVAPWMWITLVVGIDVAHVYGTLFRTYLDPAEIGRRPALYALTPLCVWLAGAVLFLQNPLLFWRGLAYLAVFHFVRQQYGFTRIYSRREMHPGERFLDAAAVYLAAVYPLVYWHTHLPRDFHWFVDGDFVALPSRLEPGLRAAYVAVLLAYVGKEIVLWWRYGRVNIPKNLLIAGTALSWYVGIVLLNGDVAFTLTNIVAHGIPYLALIWFYQHRSEASAQRQQYRWSSHLFSSAARIPAFVAVLFVFAYFEEGLWDALVWREHAAIFGPFRVLAPLGEQIGLAALVPLLAVPQATHYVLDAFIWRLRGDRAGWLAIVDSRRRAFNPD